MVLMRYIDGFVIPVPKKNVPAYRRMAAKAGKLWREHGALEYRECVSDDLKVKIGMRFPRMVKLKSGQTVVVSWILYKSRAHRDRVNAKVMQDPSIKAMCDEKSMPFDLKHIAYGGFTVMIDA